jgi:xylulokinase
VEVHISQSFPGIWVAIAVGELLVAADVGTTSVKVGLVDRHLSILAAVREDIVLSYPQPNRVEQDPEDWWRALCRAVRVLLRNHPETSRKIGGIVLAAQMCGVVAADEDGRPLRPCMVWLDKRAGALMRSSIGGWPKIAGYNAIQLLRSIQITNGAPSLNGMDPTAKMMWLRQAEPEIWANTAKLLDVKDWLLHRATGRFCTTADSAHLTWMLDTRGGKAIWSPELMKRYGIPREKLPDIIGGTDIVGSLTPPAAAELGMPAGLPVVAGCGDVCAAAIGSGATGDGELHVSLGTSAWIGGFYPGRRLSITESFATITSPAGNRPLLIATQECAGACLDWLNSVMGSPSEAHQDQSGNLPIFLPWLAGERVPIDDNRLRGAFLGLSLATSQHDLVAAVTEGIALNLRLAMSSVTRLRGTVSAGPLPVIGGAANSDQLCQTLADCLQRDLKRPMAPQYASLRGAAALASVALGWHSTPWHPEPSQGHGKTTIFRAQPEQSSYYDRRFEMFRDAVRRIVPWYQKYSDGTA